MIGFFSLLEIFFLTKAIKMLNVGLNSASLFQENWLTASFFTDDMVVSYEKGRKGRAATKQKLLEKKFLLEFSFSMYI